MKPELRNRIPLFLLGSSLLLGLLSACGGGHDSTPPAQAQAQPTGLAYMNPTGNGWRLMKDGSSTSKRLVLNLVGPTGLKSRGVGFNIKGGEGVTFTTFANGWHALETGVYELKNVEPDPHAPPPSPEPVLFAAGVKPGNLLTVGIFQKDRRATAKESGAPLVQIALNLDEAKAAGLKPGDALTLAITKARILPEDIGGMSNAFEMMAKARMADISIAVGQLSAQ